MEEGINTSQYCCVIYKLLDENFGISKKVYRYFYYKCYRPLRNYILGIISQKRLAEILYSETMENNRKINWDAPLDLNEKINYLKFYTDRSQWSVLADKYRVRDFVKERIGEQYLVPLYGVWYDINEIDFNELPKSFVLKSNNGAGSVLIVHDKNYIVEHIVRKRLKMVSIEIWTYTCRTALFIY